MYYNYNKNTKKEFYNILANFRILPFIKNENDNIKKFFKLLKDEYEKSNNWKNSKKFFDYFKLQWNKKVSVDEWNIYSIVKTCYDKNILDKVFFTNNIVESCNSRLNKLIIKNKNNIVNNFNNQINQIINQYYVSGKYNPPAFIKTKAIAIYMIETKFENNIKLIENYDLKNIFNHYRNDLYKNNKLEELIDISNSSISDSESVKNDDEISDNINIEINKDNNESNNTNNNIRNNEEINKKLHNNNNIESVNNKNMEKNNIISDTNNNNKVENKLNSK